MYLTLPLNFTKGVFKMKAKFILTLFTSIILLQGSVHATAKALKWEESGVIA